MTYLLANDNPNAPRRTDRNRFWGYPSRNATPRVVVFHTSESAFDLVGEDRGAEAVANYLAHTERTASYHAIVDRDSTVQLLPWDYTAFGARGANADGIHIAVAGEHDRWDDIPSSAVDQILDQLVPVVAEALEWAGLPAVRLSDEAARSGGRGLASHSQIDPTRRSDPGPAFPWGRLLHQLDEGEAMSWLNRWPESFRPAAETLASEHTDPDERLADLTVGRWIVFTHRFGKWIIREVVKALR